MADLTLNGSYFPMYDNAGVGIAGSKVGANTNKVANVNGLGGTIRVFECSKVNMTEAEVNALVKQFMQGGVKGVDDAVTVVGVGGALGYAHEPGVSDVIHVTVQGTGVITTGANWNGTGFTIDQIHTLHDKSEDL